MSIRSCFVLFSSFVLGLTIGCWRQFDLSGSYQTSVEATTSQGRRWHGTADVFLNQTGHSLTGNLVLHHPTAGTIQIPITSGSISDGAVLFSGHAQLPLGTVDVAFRGHVMGIGIRGSADVTVQTLFGGQTDSANLLLTKG